MKKFFKWVGIILLVFICIMSFLHFTRLLYPNYEFPNHAKISNNSVYATLSDFTLQKDSNAYKNKVIFINHWATWCGPCVKEIPQINKLYQAFKGDTQFQIISICSDLSDLEYENFCKMNQKELPQFMSTIQYPLTKIKQKGLIMSLEKLYNEEQVSAYPTNILIGKKGQLIDLSFGLDSNKMNLIIAKIQGELVEK